MAPIVVIEFPARSCHSDYFSAGTASSFEDDSVSDCSLSVEDLDAFRSCVETMSALPSTRASASSAASDLPPCMPSRRGSRSDGLDYFEESHRREQPMLQRDDAAPCKPRRTRGSVLDLSTHSTHSRPTNSPADLSPSKPNRRRSIAAVDKNQELASMAVMVPPMPKIVTARSKALAAPGRRQRTRFLSSLPRQRSEGAASA